jgi:hypothetical protein
VSFAACHSKLSHPPLQARHPSRESAVLGFICDLIRTSLLQQTAPEMVVGGGGLRRIAGRRMGHDGGGGLL